MFGDLLVCLVDVSVVVEVEGDVGDCVFGGGV